MGKINEVLDRVVIDESVFDKLLNTNPQLIKSLKKKSGDFGEAVVDFESNVLARQKRNLSGVGKALNLNGSELVLRKNVSTSRNNLKTFMADAKNGLEKLDKILADYETLLKRV